MSDHYPMEIMVCTNCEAVLDPDGQNDECHGPWRIYRYAETVSEENGEPRVLPRAVEGVDTMMVKCPSCRGDRVPIGQLCGGCQKPGNTEEEES